MVSVRPGRTCPRRKSAYNSVRRSRCRPAFQDRSLFARSRIARKIARRPSRRLVARRTSLAIFRPRRGKEHSVLRSAERESSRVAPRARRQPPWARRRLARRLCPPSGPSVGVAPAAPAALRTAAAAAAAPRPAYSRRLLRSAMVSLLTAAFAAFADRLLRRLLRQPLRPGLMHDQRDAAAAPRRQQPAV